VKQTRYAEAQIVDILAQAAKGEMTAIEVCRINGISEQTFYRSEASLRRHARLRGRRLRELEAENARTGAGVPVEAADRDHVWTYDIICDAVSSGRTLKVLAVIDELARLALAVQGAHSITARTVKASLPSSSSGMEFPRS